MTSKPEVGKTYRALDGPVDKPNGELLVRVLSAERMKPADVERFYICEVLGSIVKHGRTAPPGTTVRLSYNDFIVEVGDEK